MKPQAAARGRMIPLDTLLAIWPKRGDGCPAVSRWYLLNRFAPERRKKLGRMVYWYEADVAAAGVPIPAELPTRSAKPGHAPRHEASQERVTPSRRTAPITYDRNTVLTLTQLAAALQVEERTVQGMDLPFFYAGKRQRFIYGQVLDMLAERARNP